MWTPASTSSACRAPLESEEMGAMNFGVSIAIGVAVGAAIGVAMNNLAVGVAIGAGIGAALGAYVSSLNRRPPQDPKA